MGKEVGMNFWCRQCRHDVTLVATKAAGNYNTDHKDVWIAKCPKCGKKMVRLMENPYDPYYRLSARIRRERKIYADDLLQPGDPRFDLLYPWHKKKREELLAKEEQNKWQPKK